MVQKRNGSIVGSIWIASKSTYDCGRATLTKLVQLDHDWPIKDWDLTRLTIKYLYYHHLYLLLNLLSYKWHHKYVGFDPRIGFKKMHRSTSMSVTSTKPYQAYREFHQACECAIYVGQQNSDIHIYIYILWCFYHRWIVVIGLYIIYIYIYYAIGPPPHIYILCNYSIYI